VCVCVFERERERERDRVRNTKPSGLYINHFLLPFSVHFPSVFPLSIFLCIWLISCLYLQFSSAKQHTAPYIVYSMLHFTFYAPAHIPHCISKYVLHFHVTVCVSLHSASHYRLHCTLRSTSDTPRCIPHSKFHLTIHTGFPWFPCVYKQMLRWFPRLQVATTCFSCSPPDLNLVVTNFIFCIHVK
jgi:hypothetical protein